MKVKILSECISGCGKYVGKHCDNLRVVHDEDGVNYIFDIDGVTLTAWYQQGILAAWTNRKAEHPDDCLVVVEIIQ